MVFDFRITKNAAKVWGFKEKIDNHVAVEFNYGGPEAKTFLE